VGRPALRLAISSKIWSLQQNLWSAAETRVTTQNIAATRCKFACDVSQNWTKVKLFNGSLAQQ